MKNMDEIIKKIIDWGNNKGINNPIKQFQKLAEEMLEANEAYFEHKHARLKTKDEKFEHLIEELGDIGVVWLLLCNMLEVSPKFALYTAHEKNKERKGKTINGNFIKEEDL